MKKNLFLSILFFVITFSLSNSLLAQKKVRSLSDNLKFLSSDSLKGRFPGTPQDQLAANYIMSQFKNAGLKPLAENGMQYFKIITKVELGAKNTFSYNGTTATLKTDFTALPYTDNATLESEVVFVGYGFDINTDSLKWNDYQGLDVKGKWLLVLRGDPELDKNTSVFISYSKERNKILTAKDKGAAGVIFVSGKKLEDKDVLIAFQTSRNDSRAGLPVLNITRNIANKIIAISGKSIDSLENELNLNRKPMSFDCKMKVNAKTETIFEEVRTQNVVAMLEGTDAKLKDEYIVVGAHFDHLGMGGPESGSRMPDTIAVHNGADDNASGSVAVIDLGNKMSAVRKSLKRSIIFVCFSSEELGLLGSKYFVKNSPVDIKKIKLMFNFDMVGRLDSAQHLTVGGVGTSTESEKIINDLGKKTTLKLSLSPDGYGPSDHASFYGENIPVLYFHTGVHDDYHTPNDDFKLINLDGEQKVLNFANEVLIEMANRATALTFQEAGPKTQTASGRGFKVTFGIIPDYASTENKGLRIDGVRKAGPAAYAGLKKGDIITAVDGKAVQNIYDYMNRLGVLKVGQQVSVDILRDGKKIILIVNL